MQLRGQSDKDLTGERVRVEGTVAPGFDGVLEEFVRNFADRADRGAAFAALRGEDVLVDVWGGFADSEGGTAWTGDTLQLIFSGTKGLTAASVLKLAEESDLNLHDPVVRWWPEFAAHGKQRVNVLDVLTHRAGLAAFTSPVGPEIALDARAAAALLADQAPMWPRGAVAAYHPLTFGWLCDEIAWRVAGKDIGELFAEWFAGPLGLELWIGLPEALDHRVSRLVRDESFGISPIVAEWSYAVKVYGNPPWFETPLIWNSPRFWHVGIPAVNAIGTARSLAAFYAELAACCSPDYQGILSKESMDVARLRVIDGQDAYFDEPLTFGAGFQLQGAAWELGRSSSAFGHAGAGGSLHGSWPDDGVGFSYTMNEMRCERDDVRGRALLEALCQCLRAERRQSQPTVNIG